VEATAEVGTIDVGEEGSPPVAELGPNFWGGKMGWGGEKMGFRLISGKNLAQYI
jgi:hypothetical protein